MLRAALLDDYQGVALDYADWSVLDGRVEIEQFRRHITGESTLVDALRLTIHLVLSDRTRGLVGERELRPMKPSAFLINTSRGPIVEEEALARLLSERRIAGAGLDTFGVEPLPTGHPFRTLDNVIATPHLGYVTQRCYRIFFREIVEDIAAWIDGTPVRRI